MTPILSHLTALILGFLIATLIMWTVNRKQQQDWQAEYRRLMSGIMDALESVGVKKGNKTYQILAEIYMGDSHVTKIR